MDKNSLKVFDDEIDNLSLSNMDFVYDGEGMLFLQVQKHSVYQSRLSKSLNQQNIFMSENCCG